MAVLGHVTFDIPVSWPGARSAGVRRAFTRCEPHRRAGRRDGARQAAAACVGLRRQLRKETR